MYKYTILSTTCFAAIIAATNSQALEFGKPITTTIVISQPGNEAATTQKQVVLMNLKLTPQEQQAFFTSNKTIPLKSTEGIHLPAAVNLGMNNVPVLDQGLHGTCVTFANTAALDAILGMGDFISQLCQLELGEYLKPASSGHVPSGWEGSFGPYVLNQISLFGVVSKGYQTSQGCAGETKYPKDDPTYRGSPMTIDMFSSIEHNSISKAFTDRFYPVYLMSYTQRLHSDQALGEKVLIQVKKALNQGNRSTIGMMVFQSVTDKCSAGACASYRAKYDTWALTDEITDALSPLGHEVIVTGYDDNAFVADQNGKKHQGLLTLRNSWGEEAGDHGNYYMSYDYFRKFALEAQVIVHLDKQQSKNQNS